MTLTVDFPKTLLQGTKRSLTHIRFSAWAIFALDLLVGLVLASAWHDPTQFSRIGSLGVVIGVIFARWRFLVARKAERRLERALRNPQRWLEEALRRHHPDLPMRPAQVTKTLTADDVRDTVEGLVAELDGLMFRDEAAIIILSTLVWGYGDIVLPKVYVALFC